MPHPFAYRRRLAAGVAVAALLSAGSAAALPVPGTAPAQVNAGGALPAIQLGSSQVNVDLNAQRTIIDWQSFNLAPGETARFAFDQRNWVVLNRVTNSAININGAVQAVHAANPNLTGPAGGNVWFYSPQGVAFGANARVDVGGLLATSAAVNAGQFLDAANLNISFTGSGSGGPVTVAGGAQLVGRGHIALIAPVVSTAAGSSANAGDYGTVAYGAVDSYEIRFLGAPNNDLFFFTFIVPGVAAGTGATSTPLNIAGTTTGASNYLVAVSRQQLTGLLINAPGLITGQSSFNQYGQVTITTGRNITSGQVGETVSTPIAGALTGDVRLGEINASGNVNVSLPGTNGSGNLTADRIRSGQSLTIHSANNVTIGAGGLRGGDANVNFGNVRIIAAGTVTVPLVQARTDFEIFPGASRGPGNVVRLPVLNLGTASAGGLITFNNTNAVTATSLTAGANLTLSNNATFTTPPAVTIGTMTAGQDITITGTFGALDITTATAGGQSQMFSNQAIRLGSLTTNGYTRVSASQTITATSIRGLDLDLRSAGGVTAQTLAGTNSVSVGTGGPADIASIVAPMLSFEAISARLGTVQIAGDARVRARSFDLTGSFDAANLTIEATTPTGALQLGGTAEPGITDAEFQRIQVSGALSIYSGQTATTINEPTLRFADIEVGDLTIDPELIPTLNLYAGAANDVLITGLLKASAPGGTLNIGMPEADSPWAPDAIVIAGQLGTAEGDAVAGFTEVEAFDHVALYATNDILIGSERFVELVSPVPAAGIDIGKGLPTGVAAVDDEIGKLFLVAGDLTLGAGDRIVQQNTGQPGFEGGLYLTGEGVDAADPLLTIGRAQVADLFGALQSGDGVLAIGGQGAFSQRIARAEGDTSFGQIRINGCLLGVGCQLSTPSTQFRIEQFRPAAPRAAVDPPVLTPPPPIDDDERQAETVITGAGNEEIWRRDR